MMDAAVTAAQGWAQLAEEGKNELLGKWSIDPYHSMMGFSVRHMMVSRIRALGDVDGWFSIDEDATVQAEATIKAASIYTGNSDRDHHLRSNDFLAAQTFPDITFKGTHAELSARNAPARRVT